MLFRLAVHLVLYFHLRCLLLPNCSPLCWSSFDKKCFSPELTFFISTDIFLIFISIPRNYHSFLSATKYANYKNIFCFITNCCFNCSVKQQFLGKGRMASVGIRRNWVGDSDCVLLYKINKHIKNYVVLHNFILGFKWQHKPLELWFYCLWSQQNTSAEL